MGACACAASVTPSDRWRLLAADGVARGVPHASQNLAPGRFSAPQATQCTGSGAAHSLQNFAPVRFSQPQRGQRMVMPSLCKRLMRLGIGWDWAAKCLSLASPRTAYGLCCNGSQPAHLHPVRMTPQGVFHPATRILAGTHVVQLVAHSVYSL